MSVDPPRPVAALASAARTFVDRCETYIPPEDTLSTEGAAPLWLFDLAESACQVAMASDALNRGGEDLLFVMARARLAHGINRFSDTFGLLMGRWGWPRRGTWGAWWRDFIDSFKFGPDDQVRFARNGAPAFAPVKLPRNSRGSRTLKADMEAGRAETPLVINGAEGHAQWIVTEATQVGGPPEMLVLTGRNAAGSPCGFLLIDPFVPTIAPGELQSLKQAVELIERGIGERSTPPAGPHAVEGRGVEPSGEKTGDAAASAELAGITTEPDKGRDEWGDPIECTQAELLRAFNLGSHYPGFVEAAARRNPPPIKYLGKVGTLYRVQVRDPAVRARLLAEVTRRNRRTGAYKSAYKSENV